MKNIYPLHHNFVMKITNQKAYSAESIKLDYSIMDGSVIVHESWSFMEPEELSSAIKEEILIAVRLYDKYRAMSEKIEVFNFACSIEALCTVRRIVLKYLVNKGA